MTNFEDHAPPVDFFHADDNGGRGGEIEDHTDSKSQVRMPSDLAGVGQTPSASGGLEGPDRIFVGGLPYDSTELQVREVLEPLGELKGFDLVKDRETGNSKGYAYCAYKDVSVTDIACACLTGIKMGDKTLTVRRVNQGTMQTWAWNMLQPGPVATTVVCLTQVVNEDELRDDEEFKDIMEVMKQEGGKFGALTNVVIPRPSSGGEPVAGLGKVLFKYGDIDGSSRARRGLNGSKFRGNEVVAVFYPEDKFDQGDYGA